MKPAQWLALGFGAGLGALLGCFTAPELTGPYQCSLRGTCPDPDLSCVAGLCCKEDGGEPACPPPEVNDGGQDDGGQDGGQDGGCTVPQNPSCVIGGKQGPCATGAYSCATGTLRCNQTVFPTTETCDGTDENCDGTVDNYPCQGGPPNLLVPDADYIVGTVVASRDLTNAPFPCALDNGTITLDAGYWDGGIWRGVTSATQVLYAEKADGGYWDLSRLGQAVRMAFDGYVIQAADPPVFRVYPQPIVMLCGPVNSYRRFVPFFTNSVLVLNGSGGFSVATAVDVYDGGGGAWKVDTSTSGFDLHTVTRVEVMLTLRDPADGGVPGFDAGFTVFGFFPP